MKKLSFKKYLISLKLNNAELDNIIPLVKDFLNHTLEKFFVNEFKDTRNKGENRKKILDKKKEFIDKFFPILDSFNTKNYDDLYSFLSYISFFFKNLYKNY